ncbi:DUF1127 domain-containing protein [Paracoccus sp. (in: a-proteobacteria)]|uniref:DUF1127 domain-containing protein n=1 Tax=Paracoccus sp. TaxID=267 RepID=UPI003A89B73B
MSVTDTYRSYSVGGPGLIARIRALFASWQEARITMRELSDLSDRELADIGLCRGDIVRIARGDR